MKLYSEIINMGLDLVLITNGYNINSKVLHKTKWIWISIDIFDSKFKKNNVE